MNSVRVWIHFTGLRRRYASAGTSTSSGYTAIFGPKPPPVSGTITRMFSAGSFSTVARELRSA